MIAARTEGSPGAPLLLTFHGTGGSEAQFHALGSRLLPGAHVVSPRGEVSEQGMARYFRRTGKGVYDMDDLARRTRDMIRFIEEERDRTGATEVLAFGYSNGANILASVLFARPDLIDGAALLHPLIPFTPPDQPGLEGTRVLITAGRRDPMCPAPLTMRLSDWLEGQGAQVSLHWHEGGHELAAPEWAALQGFLAA